MSKIPCGELPDPSSSEMTEFCAAIGELILWASMIDGQLNEALVSALALPEHALIQPVVAQLDARPKAELLKKRVKLIGNGTWRKPILKWADRVETVNKDRNFVAHHGIRIRAGKITFHTEQLGKVLANLKLTGDTIEAGADKGIEDVKEWLVRAQEVFKEGILILDNLARFRAEANKRGARQGV